MARRFEDKELVRRYTKYRPTYLNIIHNTIIEYCGADCDFELAVDVACGGGQGTLPLGKHFRRVIGTDVSAEQITAAKAKENAVISFRIAPGEDMHFLENESVDLVTVASAVHWLDQDSFFKEATRVLKQGGVLAAYGYSLPTICNAEAHKWYLQFQEDLGECRDHYVFNGENMCRGIRLPFAEQTRYEGKEYTSEKSMRVEEYIGFLSTLSAWGLYLKKNPNSMLLEQFKERLLELYKDHDDGDGPSLSLSWPFYLLIGRKL